MGALISPPGDLGLQRTFLHGQDKDGEGRGIRSRKENPIFYRKIKAGVESEGENWAAGHGASLRALQGQREGAGP